MKIGSIELDNNLILAPMAGVSDLPFRLLCKEQGAGMVCMEMISAKAVTFGNKKTFALLETLPQERPVSVQLFGSEPEVMAQAAGMIDHLPFDILDINMGCPVPKVAGNGEGSALMKNPELAGEIVEQVARASSHPVTVKIRKGFDGEHVNAPEVAKICEEAGAAAVAVHGRTREQYYSGKADWEIIRRVRETVKIPVIGNGDVCDPQSAAAMQAQTGCDAVMIGRAARGNPWIFSRILTSRTTGADPGLPGKEEIVEMILRHLDLQIRYKGEDMAVREMRKHIAWYTAGLPHSARLRSQVNTAPSAGRIRAILTSILV